MLDSTDATEVEKEPECLAPGTCFTREWLSRFELLRTLTQSNQHDFAKVQGRYFLIRRFHLLVITRGQSLVQILYISGLRLAC